MKILHNDWAPLLEQEFEKPYYRELREFLKKEYHHHTIYPDMHEIYQALHTTPYQDTKVVILGQDPYHGPNQAHGFSFSVNPGIDIPPSLKNIYKELEADVGFDIPNHGYLKPWADQGVLLLNNVLTVRAHQAHSHQGAGWETFTDEVIDALNDREKPVVFMLWGKHAQKKASFVDRSRHFVIQSPHPSPLSAYRGFFGSRPFSKANRFLEEIGDSPIDWQLPHQVTRA
ncbi:uracil-DNA glycosylase [Thalassobacillus devorans]|uniref:Uracil-DNA glycosylase n=1 Tax=Thalassobacillus devorans TaxID=279813 RepID=A0ABQ1P0H1_9BACI|nr:uracil-DNA glycosylase [Thalassobacillus devorans]NIK28231.1 uracil-DNA glycosylase [Thalassobacillus devorans]GGC87862.1 uracil-DNA glycosylase [Thalassobacillus devorans]